MSPSFVVLLASVLVCTRIPPRVILHRKLVLTTNVVGKFSKSSSCFTISLFGFFFKKKKFSFQSLREGTSFESRDVAGDIAGLLSLCKAASSVVVKESQEKKMNQNKRIERKFTHRNSVPDFKEKNRKKDEKKKRPLKTSTTKLENPFLFFVFFFFVGKKSSLSPKEF